MAEDIPKHNHRIADEFLDETEIITRILYVLHQFKIYDLEKIEWNVSSLAVYEHIYLETI